MGNGNTGNRAPAARPQTTGRRALENTDSKKTGRVARQQALGETDALATSARNAQRELAQFAQRIHRRVALSEMGRLESDSQTITGAELYIARQSPTANYQ
jgi:hypothetical protein